MVMLTDSTRKYLCRIVGLYDKKKPIMIMSFVAVLCLISENFYGRLYKITGNGLAAGKIYVYFYSEEINIILYFMNK